MTTPLRLGIAGLGTVGVGVVRIIRRHAALLTARTGREIQIVAVSARDAAKDRGVAVTAGTTPAYFMLSDLALAEFRTFAHLSPPLRSEADRKAVLEAVRDGTIDVIASSHDPRGPEDKRLPFADSAPGMAGAETLLPLTLNLVRDGVIGIDRAIALLATNPAKVLGVNAGQLAIGAEADIAVMDPDKPWIVDSSEMAARAGNTPFDKQPVQGRVLALFKGGTRVGAKQAPS